MEPKLSILKELVAEQLKMRYTESTTSKHNTPIFVIPKRSGHYSLLQDLCAINDQMGKTRSMQLALPTLVLLLHLIIF